jgi:hypothetical protein
MVTGQANAGQFSGRKGADTHLTDSRSGEIKVYQSWVQCAGMHVVSTIARVAVFADECLNSTV